MTKTGRRVYAKLVGVYTQPGSRIYANSYTQNPAHVYANRHCAYTQIGCAYMYTQTRTNMLVLFWHATRYSRARAGPFKLSQCPATISDVHASVHSIFSNNGPRQQSPRLARAAVWADDVNGTSVRLVTSTPVPPWSLPTTSGHSVPVADKTTSFELLEGRRP